jgi:hypothetical protein
MADSGAGPVASRRGSISAVAASATGSSMTIQMAAAWGTDRRKLCRADSIGHLGFCDMAGLVAWFG